MPAVRHRLSYDKAPEEREWDADAAERRLRVWAGGPDKETIDWSKYREGFAWYDDKEPENFGSYKLPHHDVINGRFVVVWRGVAAAAAAVRGARGGVNLPPQDIDDVKRHLERHYEEFGRTPPWREQSVDTLKGLLEYAIINYGVESKQAKDTAKEIAKVILSNPKPRLKAPIKGYSFSWLGPIPEEALELKLVKLVATYAGRTQHEGTILQPKEEFTHDEIVRSARTLAFKLLDVDHMLYPLPLALWYPDIAKAYLQKWGLDITQPIGYILDAEEEDGKLEAVAMLDQEQAYELARQEMFTGVSVVNTYRREECGQEDGIHVCRPYGIKYLACTLCLETTPAFPDTWVRAITKNDSDITVVSSENKVYAVKLRNRATVVGEYGRLSTKLALSLLEGLRAREALEVKEKFRFGEDPPSVQIEKKPAAKTGCKHEVFVRALRYEHDRRYVSIQQVKDLIDKLEKEVSNCSHKAILAELEIPNYLAKGVISTENYNALLRQIKLALLSKPREARAGALALGE